MLKIFTFAMVFILGVIIGGGVRYSQVKAQLADVQIQNTLVPSNGASMGAAGGGSCG